MDKFYKFNINKLCFPLIQKYIGSSLQSDVLFLNPCILLLNEQYDALLSVRVMATALRSSQYERQFIIDAVGERIEWDRMIDHTCFFTFNLQDINKTLKILNINRNGDVFLINCVDLRMFKRLDQIFFSYNRYISGSSNINTKDCRKLCVFIYISEVIIIKDKDLLFIQNMEPLCMSDKISHIEKNWSMFNFPDELTSGSDNINISTWLYRDCSHKYFEYNIKNKTCNEKEMLNIFQFEKEEILLSLGSPCIFKDGINIGIGHAKVLVKKEQNYFPFPEGKWDDHPNFTRNLEYVMYFYKMNSDKSITNISKFFIIYSKDDHRRKIYFPTGIIYADNKYFISYGQGDYNSYIYTIDETLFDTLFNNVMESSDKLTIINTDLPPSIKEYVINPSAAESQITATENNAIAQSQYKSLELSEPPGPPGPPGTPGPPALHKRSLSAPTPVPSYYSKYIKYKKKYTILKNINKL
jgi:hypothetical protein